MTMMGPLNRLLNIDGRLGRAGFVFNTVMILAVCIALSCLIMLSLSGDVLQEPGQEGAPVTNFPMIVFLTVVISIYGGTTVWIQIMKRLRDMGWRRLASLWIFVPGVNVIFLFILMFRRGLPARHSCH